MTDTNRARANARRTRQARYTAARLRGATVAGAAAEIGARPGTARRYYEPIYQHDHELNEIPIIDATDHRSATQDWTTDAACTAPDVDPDWWCEVDSRTTDTSARALARLAIRICRQECPVRIECLNEARPDDETIRGGYLPRDRQAMTHHSPAVAS